MTALAYALALALQVPDSATLRVLVRHDTLPIEGASVRVGAVARATDAGGRALLRLAAGSHAVVVARIGFVPDTLALTLAAGQDTSVVVTLEERAEGLEGVVVTTRSERRVEDTPLRVEVVDEEEIAEKVAMTPGDIAMMLNETSGLRVQTTSPSLGGAGVRIQGLRGRYSLVLADGLPLYGGQGSGLGLLQIPPVDLARAEVIKGTASALYGSAALGGVINLVARRPGAEPSRELLANATSRGGSDVVGFLASPFDREGRWGGTLLLSLHDQRARDVDGDRWADIPEYRRGVVRPRLFFDDGAGRTLFATGGFTGEDRAGGTMGGDLAPDGRAYAEGLRTRRGDLGVLARMPLGTGATATVRASGVEQRHGHRFGERREDDRHRTWFAEASAALPRERWVLVAGGAWQEERYASASVAGVDYRFRVPSAFAQVDVDAAGWLVLSASGRLDRHSAYGTFASPRLSALVRLPREWTVRLSGGGGTYAPTPLTEETEATGLAPVRVPVPLVAERARSASLDAGGAVAFPFGTLELNATAFLSRLSRGVLARADTGTLAGVTPLALVNAPVPARTHGAELLARLTSGPLRATATYALLRATEWDADAGGRARRDVPLAPRHTAGLVASVEDEERGRVGVELYYTGRQALEDNPYRATSRPYAVVGLLAERIVGRARVFVNLENIGGVRQTRWDPLLLPARGAGGRWTTDAWTELAGFTVNGGVRLSL